MSADEAINRFWWLEDSKQIPDLVRRRVDEIDLATRRERREGAIFTRLYEDPVRYSSRGRFAPALEYARALGRKLDHVNVLASVINAQRSKIERNRPGIKVDTDNANWSLRRRSGAMGEIFRAYLDRWGDAGILSGLFRDGLVTQYGCVRVTDYENRVGAELVPQEEIFVDPRGAKYGNPRELFHRYEVNRHVIIERLKAMEIGDKKLSRLKGLILDAPPAQHDHRAERTDDTGHVDASMVWMYEGFHLPSGASAQNGKHVGCIEGAEEAPGALLWERPWKEQRFPYVFFRHQKKRFGFAGVPLAGQLFPIQVLIDKTLRKMVNNLHFTGDVVVLRQQGAEVDVGQMGNVGKPYEIPYTGREPKIFVPSPFSAEQFNFLEFSIRQAWELTGTNQMHGTGKVQGGANTSGIAHQEMWDQASERLSVDELEYARANKDIAELIIDTSKRIFKRTGKLTSPAKWTRRRRTGFRDVDWSKVDIDRDKFSVGLEPSNFFPETRAGKISAIETLSSAKALPPDVLTNMLGGSPDTDAALAEVNAARDYAEATLEELLDVELDAAGNIKPDTDRETPVPSPDHDLDILKRLTRARLQMEGAQGAPESVLQLLRNFEALIDEEEGRLERAVTALAPPPPVAPGLPPGVPPDIGPAGGLPPATAVPPVPDFGVA